MHKRFFIVFSSIVVLSQVLFSQKVLGQEVVDEYDILESQDMVKKMDALIEATEKALVRQQEIRKLLVEYKAVEKTAIVDPDNTDNLLKLTFIAKKLNDQIKMSFLDEYFPPQFLQELDKLAAIYDKKNIPPAK